jgi:hypothetical protein
MANREGSERPGTPTDEPPVGSPDRPPAAVPLGHQTSTEALLLARTRALMQLQGACAPLHRGKLEQTIADIDAQLGDR